MLPGFYFSFFNSLIKSFIHHFLFYFDILSSLLNFWYHTFCVLHNLQMYFEKTKLDFPSSCSHDTACLDSIGNPFIQAQCWTLRLYWLKRVVQRECQHTGQSPVFYTLMFHYCPLFREGQTTESASVWRRGPHSEELHITSVLVLKQANCLSEHAL